ncbi:hypothetical protein [Streptomyces acidiscabies]|uniref:hypothetical protein n=1 Tax=Streptomyces acidiscabies TaxID=42234 RepID=UPI0038F62DA5
MSSEHRAPQRALLLALGRDKSASHLLFLALALSDVLHVGSTEADQEAAGADSADWKDRQQERPAPVITRSPRELLHSAGPFIEGSLL